MTVIHESFYTRDNVVTIARELLGKSLFTRFGGVITGGIIVESEAYEGVTDRASHAFGNRRTPRTEVMYRRGGTAYVYLCYGIHSLFNIVTNREDIPHAILVRAIQPHTGLETMLTRAGISRLKKDTGEGPGKVSRLLGIHYRQTGMDLTVRPEDPMHDGIWLEDQGLPVTDDRILAGPRIGVDYAGKDALLPYRFRLREAGE